MNNQLFLGVICIIAYAMCQPTPNNTAGQITTGNVHFQLNARRWSPGDKFYYVGNTFRSNWYNANKFCRFHGMNLASIESSQEYDQFKKVILDAGVNDGNFWTSGTDLGQSANNFFWLSTGRPFTFANWARGEPDNDYKGTEDCVEVKKKGTTFEWNDRRCSEEIFFVCQLFNF